MKKFYITTPIYYANDIPHIGHAYTTLAADVIARYHKIRGYDVLFITGTDEHGKKIKDAAENKGMQPKEFADTLVPSFKSAWEKLNIQYDRFIRTTDPDHIIKVKEILKKLHDNGDIYKGEYEGYYCTACEAYYTQKELLKDNLCPIHKKEIEVLKEETYFFKLSKYQDKLLELYKQGFIKPDFRSKEIENRVKEGLNDISISRKNLDWGITLPFDDSHVAYVWVDALINYITAGKDFWPADIHLMAKDILWFHSVIWPAILMSAEIEIPKQVYAHGWWTIGGEKISKTTGNTMSVDELVDIAGLDPARYFLFREMSFGQDGDISKDSLIERNNNELANNFGNLVSRITNLVEKYGIEKTENSLLSKLDLENLEKLMSDLELSKYLKSVFNFIETCNKYVEDNKIWESKDKKKLYELIDSIKVISILLYPFMPDTCNKIANNLDIEIKWENINIPLEEKEIKKSEILFGKIKTP